MIEILFNEFFKRWEVYTDNSVIRAGVRQPVFVAADLLTACDYVGRLP